MIDFSQPIEWASNGGYGSASGIPAKFLGKAEPDPYAINIKTRYKISLDPENLPKGIYPSKIREHIHPDDEDKPPLSQRVIIYANVFETGYVGDGSPCKVENVHVREARQKRIKARRQEKASMTENNLWGMF